MPWRRSVEATDEARVLALLGVDAADPACITSKLSLPLSSSPIEDFLEACALVLSSSLIFSSSCRVSSLHRLFLFVDPPIQPSQFCSRIPLSRLDPLSAEVNTAPSHIALSIWATRSSDHNLESPVGAVCCVSH